MPIYEYECTKCGNQFEKLVNINEKPDISCDSCNGKQVRRRLSPGAFVFKGSGFYATDYTNATGKQESQKTAAASPPSCSDCAEAGKCPAAGND